MESNGDILPDTDIVLTNYESKKIKDLEKQLYDANVIDLYDFLFFCTRLNQ